MTIINGITFILVLLVITATTVVFLLHTNQDSSLPLWASGRVLLTLERPAASPRDLDPAVDSRIPLKFVLIGDSYSSGNGARDENGDRNYFGPEYCYRMRGNWGQTYANELSKTGQYAVTFLNRACASGKTSDVFSPQFQLAYSGRCPKPQFPDDLYVQTTLFTCQYYVMPQLDAVNNETDLVMFTFGPNDWGVGGITWSCMAAHQDEACLLAIDRSKSLILNLQANLTKVLTAVYSKMKPSGKVVVVSTPLNVIENVSLSMKVHPDTTFDAVVELRTLIKRSLGYGKAAVDAANTAAGVPFAFFYNETPYFFAGHETDPRWFHRNPVGWIRELDTYWTNEIFHPKAEAWKEWGKLIAKQGTFGLEISRRAVSGNPLPHAWMGEAYSGRVGVPVIFEAFGSYDPQGYQLVLYEWDFDNDGVFEVQTTQATVSRTYSKHGFSVAVLRVTSQSGQTATTQAIVQIRRDY